MKKINLLLILLILCCSIYAQNQPKINFYLNDGSLKQYYIADIDNLSIINGNPLLMMKIFSQGTSSSNFLTEDIESIKFENENLNIIVSGNTNSFLLSEIDSINFFIPDSPIPQIVSIDPLQVRIGDEITVFGTNFGTTLGTNVLSFKGKNATQYIYWNDSQFKAIVPLGALTGKAFVTVKGISSNGMDVQIIPQISSTDKQSGREGDVITIKGNGFGIVQPNSTVSFNNIKVKNTSSWNDTTILARVPHGARTGNITINSYGNSSNGLLFTVLPKIDSIVPASAHVADTIKIFGSCFGAKRDTSIISFNTIKAIDYIDWNDTIITVKVPANSKTGKLFAKIFADKSNEVDFSIIPHISKVSPDSAGITEEITIEGNGFSDTKDKNAILFNDRECTQIKSWTDTKIKLNVPEGIESGKISVKVGNQISNEVNFTLIQHLILVDPTSAKIGDKITITGTNFGVSQGTSYICFDTLKTTVTDNWLDNEITLMVPPGANTGKLSVTISQKKSNELDFAVIPDIKAINPSSAMLGGTVTISGTGFGEPRNNSTVTFGGVAPGTSDYLNWTATSIVVKVPVNAKHGKVTVTVGKNTSNEFDFTILPTIKSISPTGGITGDEVTITGKSFGDAQGGSTISFNGTNATEITKWEDGEIITKVPVGTTTGNVTVKVGSNTSNGFNFAIRPNITGINPASGSVGDQITISGSGFGNSRGSSKVTFYNGKDAANGDYMEWGNTRIVVKVPTGAITGQLSVTVNNVKSNEISFTVNIPPTTYEEVTIGSQVWMLKNLDVTTYRNGDAIPQVTDATQWANLTTGAWCYYNNDEANAEVYGKLYNWYAVNDSRGLAPEGWHIPSQNDYNSLINFLGGIYEGGKLKETGYTHWNEPNAEATNESGFTALPGGSRQVNGSWTYLQTKGHWWDSTEGTSSAHLIYLWSISDSISNMFGSKKYGCSVRCIKD